MIKAMIKISKKTIALIIASVFMTAFILISLTIATVLFIRSSNAIQSNTLNISSASSDLNSSPLTTIIQSTPIPTQNTNIVSYLVPVTGFKELRNNISLQDLKNSKVIVMESDKDLISKNFPNLNLESLNDKNYIEKLANGNDIGLIPWQKLAPQLKVLSVDNMSFLDKTIDRSKYPFQYSVTSYTSSVTSTTQDNASFNINNLTRIVSTGEIIPARTVDKIMRLKNNYQYPFEAVKPFLDKFDARIGTLESPLLGTGNGSTCALGCMNFVANEKFSTGLQYSGINLVTLADNHSMNAGIAGISNTLTILDSIGIKHVGAAITNNEDATDPAIIDVNGIRYGVLGYDDIPSVNDWATDTKGGTGRIDDNNYHILAGRVAKDVKRAKDKGAQFVIAMMHWGAREYTNEPLPHQKELAHNLIDNGVDLVVGDHPHWVMSTEFYTPLTGGDAKFIYYGIGNFVFDQDWSVETSQGSFLEMNFYNNKLISLHIYPHHIYLTQPRIVDESSPEYKQIMDRIWQFTGKINV